MLQGASSKPLVTLKSQRLLKPSFKIGHATWNAGLSTTPKAYHITQKIKFRENKTWHDTAITFI